MGSEVCLCLDIPAPLTSAGGGLPIKPWEQGGGSGVCSSQGLGLCSVSERPWDTGSSVPLQNSRRQTGFLCLSLFSLQAPCHHHLPSAGMEAPQGLYLLLPSCLPGLGWRTREVGPGHRFPQTGQEQAHHHHHRHLHQHSGTASRTQAMVSCAPSYLPS